MDRVCGTFGPPILPILFLKLWWILSEIFIMITRVNPAGAEWGILIVTPFSVLFHIVHIILVINTADDLIKKVWRYKLRK